MFTLELNDKLENVELFLDADGIDELISVLGSMRGEAGHHARLMTRALGGKELDAFPHHQDKPVNHPIVYSIV